MKIKMFIPLSVAIILMASEGVKGQYQTYVAPESRVLNTTTAAVGSTSGSFAVNDFGEAFYQIPVFTSPGTAGMVPGISLVYNSNSGDGIMGTGWAIAGLSSIHRVPKNLYHENMVDGVDLSANDRLALDGNRLILAGGVYGEDQSVYRTEFETFTTVTAYGTAGSGPSWFKAETKDGRTIEYGNTVDSKVEANGSSTVNFWRMNRVTDKFGNYLRFTYNEINGESYISRIDYTGSGTTQEPYNSLKFLYSQRSDINSTFIGGYKVPSTMILSSIRMEAENNLVREYQLKYFTDSYNKTHLNEIKEFGKDGSSFNSTLFGWSEYSPAFKIDSISPTNTSGGKRYFGDFNGDGLQDFIHFPNSLQWSVCVGIDGRTFRTVGTYQKATDFKDFMIADSDGDGMDNIYMHRKLSTQHVYEHYVYEMTYNNLFPELSTDEIIRNSSADITVIDTLDLQCSVGDFDGNGTMDQVFFRQDSTIHSFSGITVGLNGLPPHTAISIFELLDFDGDGRQEILIGEGQGCYIYQYNPVTQVFGVIFYSSYFFPFTTRLYIGDFNGDDKDDILYFQVRTVNKVSATLKFSNGVGFTNASYTPGLRTITDPWASPNDDNYYIGDYNGDGLADILESYLFGTSSVLKVYYSYGDGRTFSTLYNFPTSIIHDTFFTIGDFSGKGYSEIMYHDFVDYNDGETCMLSFHEGHSTPRIEQIQDGLGNNIKVDYLPINDKEEQFYDFWPYSSDYPNIVINGAQYAVRHVLCSTGTTDGASEDIERLTTYSYGGLYTNRSGKGLLGFRMTRKEDSMTAITTSKSFNFLNDLPLLRLESQEHSNVQGIISTYSPTWNAIDYGNKRILPYVSTDNFTDNLNNTSVSFTNNIDNNGNIASIQKTNKNGSNTELTTNVTYSNYNSYGNWGIPNRPQSITTMTTYKTKDPVTTTVGFVYNSDGTVSSETHFAGTPKEILRSYFYYSSGNLHTSTLSAQGMTPRTTSYEYDPRSRFVTTIEAPDGKESFSVSDPGTGNMLSVTGIDNLTTTYEYDGFGRLVTTTTPMEHEITTTIGWDNSSTDIPSLYYSTATAPGRAGVTEYYDSFGRTLRSARNAFGGTVFVDKVFAPDGTVQKSSWPYRSGDDLRWTEYSYDDYLRLTEENNNSLITSFTYSANTITVEDPSNKTKSTVFNSLSQPVLVTENDNSQISYDYNSFGQVCTVTAPENSVSLFYDQFGLQDSIYSSNTGGIKLAYNAYRELISQTDANDLETQVQYDVLGRIVSQTTPEGTTSYTYIGTGNGVRQISTVTGPGGVSEGYSYDSYGRLTNYSKAIQNEITLNYQYLYDQYGNNTGIVYPSAMQINNIYDSYGNLTEIRQENGTLIWQLNSVRATGNPTQYTLGPNSLTRTYGYDTYEHLTGITTGLWQQSYLFDAPSGNLTSRSYKNVNSMDVLTEDFDYDPMNRLTSSQVDGLQQYSVTYGQGGNILTKSDAGDYTYDQTKVNALISLENNPGTISPEIQSLTYNSQNKPLLITEGEYTGSFLYGTDGQRFRSELSRNDTLIKTRYYAPGYEKTVTADSTWENYYIVSPYGLAALIVKQDTTNRIYYAETDHLGSLIGLMNGDGTFAERFSYDAWGRRRNPADWSYSDVPGVVLTERGFTGHEHMDLFGLINMNGRIYDPVTARFLNADPVIQNPYCAQDYNSYSYCNSNPLKYIDPDGYKKSYYHPPNPAYIRVPGRYDVYTYMIGDAGFGSGTAGGGGGSNGGDVVWREYIKATMSGYSEGYDNFSEDCWANSGEDSFTISWETKFMYVSGSQQEIRDEDGKLVEIRLPEFSWGYIRSSITISGNSANNGPAGQGGNATAGLGLGTSAYWGGTVNTLYGMHESKNLANNMAKANAHKSVTGTVTKSIRGSISYGKSMTTVTKAAGRGLFVVGTAMTVYEMTTNPTTENLILGSADLIMGVISIGCPVVGLVYWTGRIIYDIVSEE